MITLFRQQISEIMKVLLIRGLAASGKTTLSQKIYDSMEDAHLWSKDKVFDKLLSEGVDWEEANKRTYKNLYECLVAQKGLEGLFIIDAPFYRLEDLNLIRAFCAQHEWSMKSILVSCSSEDEWRHRFELRRTKPKPNQKITDYDDIKAYYGSMAVMPLEGEFVYDSFCPTELEEILRFLGSSKQRTF